MEEYALIVVNWVKNPQNWEELLNKIAEFCGVTSANGRTLLAAGLIIAVIVVLVVAIKLIITYWDTLLEGALILSAAYQFQDSLRQVFNLIADTLGVTSTEGRIWLAVALSVVGLIVCIVIIKWFIKKVFAPKKTLDEKELQASLRELHDYVFLRGNIPAYINMVEGHDTLIFEWLSYHLTEKSYKAELTGSIEGRIKMSGAEVKCERTKINFNGVEYKKISLKVIIPAGYFMVNFDLSDVNGISYSGWFANYYTPEEIRRYFDTQCPNLVLQFIDDNNILAQTKEIARKYIESQIKNIVDPTEYKVEVDVIFSNKAWRVFRGTSTAPLGIVDDK